MSALGLAIMIVAGAVTLDVVLENTRNTDASVVGQTIANVDLGGFFTAGVLVGVALMLGVMLLLAGLKRANRKRLERKELARNYEGSAAQAETLQEERDRLAAELEQERAARHNTSRTAAASPAVAGAAGADDRQPMRAEHRQAGSPQVTAQQPQVTTQEGQAPIYPTDSSAAPGPVAGTATEERTKPSLKDRFLGR